MSRKRFFVVLLIFIFSNSFAQEFASCLENPKKQKARSKEIFKIFTEDQDDREKWSEYTQEELLEVVKRDLAHRMRIGEIFGEGCLTSADDFFYAAMIYQHGNVSEHYYQAFIWANRSAHLGKKSAKNLAALAIDRYLVSIDHKQLFGSQAFKSNETNNCFCMQEVESTFPESFRYDFAGFTLQDQVNWIGSLNEGKACPELICPISLKPTPEGFLPGFW